MPTSFVHSTPSADRVCGLATALYDIGPILDCRLLTSGFNDCYALTTHAGERFVLRLSLASHRLRGAADVAAETAFLAYLASVNAPVAHIEPTKAGKLFSTVALPDGLRPLVLFPHLGGRQPDPDCAKDARAQGVTLARVHAAADHFPGRNNGAHRLDLNHLLHKPMKAILALETCTSDTRYDLVGLETRLADAVAQLDNELTRTYCHGDVHGFNARIAVTGPQAGEAVFFDFDDSGYGYLAYDLAVHLWAQVSFGRRNLPVWRAFDAGYRSVRPLKAVDEFAVPIFVAIRHIWLMGEWAAGIPRAGTQSMPDPWIDNEVGFLLNWERDQLGQRLF